MRHRNLAWMMVMVLWLSAVTCLAQTPGITGITPGSAAPGTLVTISGTGFGSSQGLANTVSFAGVSSSPRVVAASWTSQSIVVAVPASAISGNVVVTVAGHASNSFGFTVTPTISGVTPGAALAGASVTINGSGFGNSQAAGASTVAFNGTAATATSWSSSSIVAVVPVTATAGNVVVTVAGRASMPVTGGSAGFTPTPAINGLSPAAAAGGASVIISGNSFGASQGSSAVTFNGVAASVGSWSNTSIVATVPNNTSTGPVIVTVNGVSSGGAGFTVTPGITGVSPNPGLAGSLVTIAGTNFGSAQGSGTVTFAGAAAQVSSWSNTVIVARVPNNATAGPVVVTASGLASNGIQFSLTPLYSYSLTYAPDGDILTGQDSVNGNWSYSYDSFNRLTTALSSSPQQGLSYAYDQYGNRWQQNVTAGTGISSLLTFSSGAAGTNGSCYRGTGMTNQPDGYCFDAAGNLLNDGQHTYAYDAENRLTAIDGGQTTFVYDGSGQRVRKTGPAGTSDYLYDVNGHMVTEISGTGTWNRSEIYAQERHLGSYSSGQTYFSQADWLETERTRVLPTGDVFETCSNLPFGDGLKCTGANDPSPRHFTGKERDAESGLDYFGARYYHSSMGRLLSVDPVPMSAAHMQEPQRWNQYSYATNNPVRNIDADGRFSLDGHKNITIAAFRRAGLDPNGYLFKKVLDANFRVDLGGAHGGKIIAAQFGPGHQHDHFLKAPEPENQLGAYNGAMARLKSLSEAAYAKIKNTGFGAGADEVGGASHTIEDSYAHTVRDASGAIIAITCFTCAKVLGTGKHTHHDPPATKANGSLTEQGSAAADATAAYFMLMMNAEHMTTDQFHREYDLWAQKYFRLNLKDPSH